MFSTPLEIEILVLGCSIAWADRPDICGLSKSRILESGLTLDLDSIRRDQMAAVIVGKIDLLQTKR
jgi:hypothetical protein